MRALRGIMRAIAKEYIKRLEPELSGIAKQDAGPLSHVFDVLGVQVEVAIPKTVGSLFDKMATGVAKGNAKQQAALLGIKPSDTGVADRIAAARDENIKVVENAHRAYAQSVRDIFDDPKTFGMRVEDIKAKLLERGDVSESRAELIARDQTLKLNGEITKVRQQNAGVESYVWSTSLDDRVREEHAALEGQTFSWSNPPAPGHPGSDFQCRCVAIGVVAELDEVFG